MVEQNARAGIHAVALAIVHSDVVAEHLCAAIRRTRVERGEFCLRYFTYFAEHFRRRGLVKTHRVVLSATHHANSFEHAQYTKTRGVCSELGLGPREMHKGNCAQVVNFGGLSALESRHQTGQVGEVARHQFNIGELIAQEFGTRVVLTLDHAKDFITLGVQELCKVLSVLTCNSGN